MEPSGKEYEQNYIQALPHNINYLITFLKDTCVLGEYFQVVKSVIRNIRPITIFSNADAIWLPCSNHDNSF